MAAATFPLAEAGEPEALIEAADGITDVVEFRNDGVLNFAQPHDESHHDERGDDHEFGRDDETIFIVPEKEKSRPCFVPMGREFDVSLRTMPTRNDDQIAVSSRPRESEFTWGNGRSCTASEICRAQSSRQSSHAAETADECGSCASEKLTGRDRPSAQQNTRMLNRFNIRVFKCGQTMSACGEPAGVLGSANEGRSDRVSVRPVVG